ncbi:MAG TPA: hypothetical protein VGE65_09145 [Sphingobium sp.]
MGGGQTFSIDRFARLCRIVGTGMWTAADARRHFAEIELALRPLRETGRPITFLIDMRGAAVQPRETALAMGEGAACLHRETDIVAVVTGSVLHAMQVKAHSKVHCLETFQCMEEAESWMAEQRQTA